MSNECKEIKEIITIAAFIVNTLALIVVIIQAHHSKKSLNLTKKSIDDATSTRQIASLQKSQSIINVMVKLEMWQKDLQKQVADMEQAKRNKDTDTLRGISVHSIKTPHDLDIHRIDYEKMPAWLREIWMSGAQFYYNAAVTANQLWTEKSGSNFDAIDALLDRFKESIAALHILHNYIKDMIPPIILYTPASLSDEVFLID